MEVTAKKVKSTEVQKEVAGLQSQWCIWAFKEPFQSYTCGKCQPGRGEGKIQNSVFKHNITEGSGWYVKLLQGGRFQLKANTVP